MIELMMANIFSQQRVEMEHERELSSCQLRKQSDDISSVSDILSALSCDITRLHQTLSEQSQSWLQVWFGCLDYVLNITVRV